MSVGPTGEARGEARGGAIHRLGVWPLVTASEMQALDRHTIEARGLPGSLLMESAGRALVAPVLAWRRRAKRPEAPIRALCGAGNNGGDGFVLVRHLMTEGIPAEAVLVGDSKRLPRDAATNWQRLEALDAPRRVIDPKDEDLDWGALLGGTSVAVDALFGTGLKREIAGGYARLIEALDAARRDGLRVVSVDVPSGIAANAGQVLGVAVTADATVTISLPKIGLALEPGRSHAGLVVVARVGIDDPDPHRLPRVELWNARAVAERLPDRGRAGHKGSFGHVLVVAGSAGKTGAAALSARAAARAGAGLVTLAHPSGIEAELSGLPVEVMSAPVAATPAGGFAHAGEKAIDELVASRDVVALGPGLGQDPETVDLVRRLVGTIDRPLVIDADGLNALVGQLGRLADRPQPAVLTPHPGEAARLLDTDAGGVNADRVAAARQLAAASGSIVLLKGAATVVAEPKGRACIVPTGGPVLATGGTGDVLTGVVAALLAQGLDAFDAAAVAAWWHGATADRAPQRGVGFGMLASELADGLPAAAEEIRRVGGAGTVGSAADAATAQPEDGTDGALALRFPGP